MASIYDKSSLVLIPSGTKTGKVYSQKPVSGDGDFTFTRSSAATRVNADGFIEKETQNLLLQSNQFDTTWTLNNASVTSGQSGYDGTNDAWKLQATANGGSAYISNAVSLTSIKSCSVYAKAGSYDYIIVQCGGGTASYTWFDLTNGAVGTEINVIDSKIESVGGGWYRCSITAQGTHTGATIYAAPSNGGVSVSAGNYIYIQNAQLEQGLVARDYIETTTTAVEGGITDNVPRLDYTDSSCPALLLEPQRTNLIDYSEYFNLYSTYGSPTITANAITSPEGVVNATKVERGTNSVPLRIGGITTLGTQYTMSLWAKAGTATKIKIEIGDETAPTYDLTSEWQRIDVTSTPNTYTHLDIEMPLSSNGDYFYIYGLQLEASASYPTSYIPTYGSSVTRTADYSVRSDMQDYVGADEGTWFMHFKDLFFDITGTGQGSINLVYNSGNQIEFIQDGNLQYKITLNNSTAVSNLDGEDKVAIAWSLSGLVIYINGVSAYTSSSSVYANPYSQFELTRVDRRPRVDMKQILFFKTRLSNEELAALTTI